MAKLLLASSDSTEPDPDRAPLTDALQRAGHDVTWPDWADSTVNWSEADLVMPRATWNYYEAPDAFLDWYRGVDAVTRVANPVSVVERNIHKSYLTALDAAGVSTVPTRVFGAGSATSLDDAASGWKEFVIKPAISCNSWNTFAGDAATHERWAALLGERDMMVQPFVESVRDLGERSLVVVGGQCTHVMRKSARFSGACESVDGPFAPTVEELAVVAAVLAWVGTAVSYARIDVVCGNAGELWVAEVELIEPSLYVGFSEHALRTLVSTISRLIP